MKSEWADYAAGNLITNNNKNIDNSHVYQVSVSRQCQL